MTTCDRSVFAAAVSTRQPHPQLAMKAGAVAAGTVMAGAAFLGAAPAGPTASAGLVDHVQRDVAFAAAPTFNDSLKALLDALGIGQQQLNELIGGQMTLGSLLGALPGDLDTSSQLRELLAELNPTDTTLDQISGGLLSEDVGALLSTMYIGNDPVSSLDIDDLAAALLGADPSSTSILDLFDAFGLGEFSGLVGGLCGFGDVVLGICLDPLTADDDVSELLSSLLQTDTSTTTLGDYLDNTDITIGGITIALSDAEIGQLLGIPDVNVPWDDFLSNISTTGPLGTPTPWGDETLAAVLSDLLPHGSTLTVGDATAVADYLLALDPAFFGLTLDDLLGL
ncbi:hypothetical protein [Mycobacterium shimoidei]|nr:hypothetical protein [Mycobacterium shimoidei]